MASDELKEIRAKLTKEAINDHQMSYQGGTKTTLFKCGRCGKRDCTYNQVRSFTSLPFHVWFFCVSLFLFTADFVNICMYSVSLVWVSSHKFVQHKYNDATEGANPVGEK